MSRVLLFTLTVDDDCDVPTVGEAFDATNVNSEWHDVRFLGARETMPDAPPSITALLARSPEHVYVTGDRRYVAVHAAEYGAADGVRSPTAAAHAALGLTRDDGCNGTMWTVYDRQTGEVSIVEQGGFDTGEGLA